MNLKTQKLNKQKFASPLVVVIICIALADANRDSWSFVLGAVQRTKKEQSQRAHNSRFITRYNRWLEGTSRGQDNEIIDSN